MKITILFFIVFLVWKDVLVAQATPPLEEQLTTLWTQSNYTELRALLDARTTATPPDVVALYCAKFFYIFVQPNKVKALAAATKLMAAAKATTDPDFIAFASREVSEVKGIPDSEFMQPAPEILTAWHAEFPAKYPNVDMGVRLRVYKKP